MTSALLNSVPHSTFADLQPNFEKCVQNYPLGEPERSGPRLEAASPLARRPEADKHSCGDANPRPKSEDPIPKAGLSEGAAKSLSACQTEDEKKHDRKTISTHFEPSSSRCEDRSMLSGPVARSADPGDRCRESPAGKVQCDLVIDMPAHHSLAER